MWVGMHGEEMMGGPGVVLERLEPLDRLRWSWF